MVKKNTYDRTSQKVFVKTCPHCGAKNEVLESFAYYLKEHLFNQPNTVVTCGTCKKGELKI